MNAGVRLSVAFVALGAVVFAQTPAKPLRVALFVDTSAGTDNAMPQVREAVAAFLDALPPEHEVALVTTGRRTQTRVQPTLDRAKLHTSAKGLTSDGGSTPLLDALLEIDERFLRKDAGHRPAIVVITGDGGESSKDTDEQAFNKWIASLRTRDVRTSAVVLKRSGSGLPESIVSMVTRATGGRVVAMSNGAGMPEALKQIAEQLGADTPPRH